MAPDVDIETLRLLIAVSEKGSLNRAAAARGISQPAASKRVRAFETKWRLSVLRRSPQGSSLTTDGLAVASWSREVLHAADTMRAGLDALSVERSSEISVAASLTVAEFILPRWLDELHTRQPTLQPRLHVVNSDRVAELVREGAADVGFIETATRPVDLARRVIGSDRLIVVVRPDHPWALRNTPVDNVTLAGAHWALRESGSGTRSTFEWALRREPLVAIEASSTTALIGAALAGIGPAVVSARAVQAELSTGRLVAVATTLDLLRPLTAVWRKDVRLAPAVLELLSIASASTHSPGG